jgi:hypothetical protein
VGVVEELIIGLLIALFTGLLGATIASKNKATIEDLNRHKDALVPHNACPVHTTKLEAIERTLASIENKLDRLITRD